MLGRMNCRIRRGGRYHQWLKKGRECELGERKKYKKGGGKGTEKTPNAWERCKEIGSKGIHPEIQCL